MRKKQVSLCKIDLFRFLRDAMKKVHITIWILLLLILPKLSLASCEEYYKTATEGQLLHDKEVPEGAILFFGDSIIEFMNISDGTDKSANFGITCDTIPRLTNRIIYYQSIKTASKIFINIGVNDILFYKPISSEKDYYTYTYKQLISKLPKKTSVFFISILPVNENQGDHLKGRNKNISTVNTILKKLCEANPNLNYIGDLGLADSTGNLSMKYSTDGLHLSPAGYDILIKKLMAS